MWEMPVKHGDIGAMNRKAHCAMAIGLTLTVALGGVVALTVHPNAVCAASPETSFQEDVFPIFKGRCIDCHQPGGQGYEKSGLDLSTYEGVMKGTKYGPMIVPGDPDTSNLMWLLDWKASPELRMPHGKKKLSTCDRDAIRHWIREGAKNN
jgi:mono/diheme cytochrome c family protein